MKHWYVVRSKHRNEVLLWHQLCRRGIEVYYPRISTGGADMPATKSRPYYPGCMFVHIDLDTHAQSALQWMPGAAGFVMFGGEPAYIADSILRGIQERVERTSLKRANPSVRMQPDDKSQAYAGPFAGYRGIFGSQLSDRDRAAVFLRFIRDQQMRLQLPVMQMKLTRPCRTRL